jgi:cytochrome c oxidase subunit 2
VSSNKIVPLEKKVFLMAFLFCLMLLAFIAIATFKFGISLPGCVKDVKPFKEGSLTKTSHEHYELHSVAKMWAFDPRDISLPKGSTLDIFLSSLDVNHGFHIAGTNVNLMAVPGTVNYAQVTFNKVGDYPIVCHEYCGVAHESMNAMIHVVEEGDARLTPLVSNDVQNNPPQNNPLQQPALADSKEDPLARAKKVFQDKGCFACHSLTGETMVGPTFKGLYQSMVTMDDGSQVLADDAYITQSIKEPQKNNVKGYQNVMPPLPVSEEEVKLLIELIKSVR